MGGKVFVMLGSMQKMGPLDLFNPWCKCEAKVGPTGEAIPINY